MFISVYSDKCELASKGGETRSGIVWGMVLFSWIVDYEYKNDKAIEKE